MKPSLTREAGTGLRIYASGKKGLSCLQGAVSSQSSRSIAEVLVGKDTHVLDDFSDKILEYCQQQQIPSAIFPNTLTGKYLMAIAAGWQRLIHDVPSEKLIVFHDSLLPKYRGFNPLVTAVLNQDSSVGVTALRGEARYDTGSIYLQKSIPVIYPTTIGKVIDDVATLYAELASEVATKILCQSLTSTPQDESKVTYSLWRDEEDYRIDWHEDSKKLEHFVACVGFPYKGATFVAKGNLYRLSAATAVGDVQIANRSPGKIIFFENNKPVVVCGRGLLRLDAFHDDLTGNLKSLMLRTRMT
ncbi:MAG: formyltransferase family protein [Verrucomicrobiota bacterium]